MNQQRKNLLKLLIRTSIKEYVEKKDYETLDKSLSNLRWFVANFNNDLLKEENISIEDIKQDINIEDEKEINNILNDILSSL